MALLVRLLALLLLASLAAPTAGREGWTRMKRDDARKIFETELAKRHVKFTRLPESMLYRIETNGMEQTINLENKARELAREGDPGIVRHFVEQVLTIAKLPPWPEARGLVYWSAEPSDHSFGDTIHERVTGTVARVLVVTDLKEGKITWLTPGMVADWGVTEEAVQGAATDNLSRLLEGKRASFEEIEGMKLGMAPISSVFKASIIFSPRFKGFVSEVGWPVLVVIPCRDFLYVIAEKDKALLNRMGGVVQQEYRQSGYPITTEVLRLSDRGIEAIGAFPE